MSRVRCFDFRRAEHATKATAGEMRDTSEARRFGYDGSVPFWRANLALP